MHRLARHITSLGFVAGLVATLGCEPGLPHKVAFAGQSATLQSGTQVNFQDAWCHAEKCEVRLWIANLTDGPMFVDRDGFALRLPVGRIIRREGAVHDAYNIAPGATHPVNLGFVDRQLDLRTASGVSLVVGGVAFANDPRPRVVGEIPLVANGPHY